MQGARFYDSGCGFKIPIASRGRIAGGIVGSRHVGAGQSGHRFYKINAASISANGATVQQQVAIAAEGIPPLTHLVGIRGKIRAVQGYMPQGQAPVTAMRDDVDSGKVCVLGESGAYLLDFILSGIQGDDKNLLVFIFITDVRDNAISQDIRGGNRIIHKNNLGHC